mgnify:CR=1 FL=1
MLPFWAVFTAPPPSLEIDAEISAIRSKRAIDSTVLDLVTAGYEQIDQGDYSAAIGSFQSARSLIAGSDNTDSDNTDIEGEILYGLGEAYFYSQQYAEAIPVLEAAIAFYSPTPVLNLETADYLDILISLSTWLAYSHQSLSHFGSALVYYQQLSGPTVTARLPPSTLAALLTNKGTVEAEIGQYETATTTLQQAAELNHQLSESIAEANAIAALGWIVERQDRLDDAIAYYQSAIALYQQADEPIREIRILNNLGIVHLKQNDLSSAESTLNQAQTRLSQQTDISESLPENLRERAILLDSFGSLYQAQGNIEQAWSAYRQALALSLTNADKVGEIDSLINLGKLMEAQSQPSLAIFFYKQAIAQIETIRADLRSLSQTVQQRYTLTVEDIYRNLADLLLRQDRVPEALHILELLKLQEVKAYLNTDSASTYSTDADSTDADSTDADSTDADSTDADSTDPAPPIPPASESSALNTPAEATLAATLTPLPADLSLTAFTQRPEALALQDSSAPQPPTAANSTTFQLATIESLQAALKAQPVKTAALYPLILKDRLEIILITADGIPSHYTTQVLETELSQTIHQFQNKLKTDVLDPAAEAQQLYTWLIQPLEATLAEQNIESLIYLPDGVLRYVPIAVLHDGHHWLTEKYQSYNITAAAIDDLTAPTSQAALTVLAGALTDESPAYDVQVGQASYRYDGLPAAREEIGNLLKVIPTTALINQDFTPSNTLNAVQDHPIVHFATHANFLPGQPESSFILFGDGSTVNMRDIGRWRLPNVDLVVFSACQTAVSVEGDGKELLGLGFQIQQTGAGAAIATLWSVDDTATAAFMNQFYIALSKGSTKAQALRQAQIDLIDSQSFQHPYDWAAFILIGNGL